MDNITPAVSARLRGIVEMSELDVEALNILRKKIFSRKDVNIEAANREFEWQAQLLQAGLPPVYWDVEWAKFSGDQKAKGLVKKYCDVLPDALEAGQGIIFLGKHGTGKTSLSCLIAKEALRKGYTVKYFPMMKLLDNILKSFDDKEFKEDLATTVERIEFLIFDDLGKEYLGAKKQLNPMVQLTLDAFLRERMNRKLVTIASTNYDKEAIKDQYGDSVLSVLYGACKFVEVKGEDYRLIRGQEFWDKLK